MRPWPYGGLWRQKQTNKQTRKEPVASTTNIPMTSKTSFLSGYHYTAFFVTFLNSYVKCACNFVEVLGLVGFGLWLWQVLTATSVPIYPTLSRNGLYSQKPTPVL